MYQGDYTEQCSQDRFVIEEDTRRDQTLVVWSNTHTHTYIFDRIKLDYLSSMAFNKDPPSDGTSEQ